jgi:hypothetical protein
MVTIWGPFQEYAANHVTVYGAVPPVTVPVNCMGLELGVIVAGYAFEAVIIETLSGGPTCADCVVCMDCAGKTLTVIDATTGLSWLSFTKSVPSALTRKKLIVFDPAVGIAIWAVHVIAYVLGSL